MTTPQCPRLALYFPEDIKANHIDDHNNSVRKIPVFYHIPKNAGTYFYNCILSEVRKINHNVCIIRVFDNQHILAKIIVSNENLSLFGNKLIPLQNRNDHWYLNIIDLSEDLIEKLSILFVSIEASGFRKIETSLKLVFLSLSKFVLYKFIIFREPFSREQSLYYYLTSDKSKHEATHGVFKSLSFEEHILSKQLQDSWLTRSLLNIPFGTKILTEENFNKVCSILETFEIYDIKQIEKAINDTLLKCFNVKNFDPKEMSSSQKNQNTYNKIKLHELPSDAQQRFNERKYWDQKLYNHFIQ